MILRELYDLAQREGLAADQGVAPQRISFVVVVGKGGRLRSIISTLTSTALTSGKEVMTAKWFKVPRYEVRSVNVKAQLLWDNAQYVFGVDAGKEKKAPRKRLDQCRKAFLSACREAAQGAKDPAAEDVVAFLEKLEASPWDVTELQRRCGVDRIEPNANFAFRHESDSEDLVTDRPRVRRWLVARQGGSGGPRIRCLVTGEMAEEMESHPPLKKLAGALAKGVPLVSFNNSAFESYGLSGNENAPIGRPAAEAVATALNRLLDRDYPSPVDCTPMPLRNVRIAEDTTVLYWSRNQRAPVDLFGGGVDADPEKVRALYEAPHGGRPPVLDDESPFFALALSGEMARAKVRGWYETTLGRALQNVKAHFDDFGIVGLDAGEPLPLRVLLEAVAPLGDSERLPPAIASGVFASIIDGRAYPRAMLMLAVRRERAAPTRSSDPKKAWILRRHATGRAAALKAYLSRARRKGLLPASFPEVTPHMDTASKSVPYRLGRLFSTLEKLQEEALPGTNATIRDRFFGAASATPVTVFPRLIRGAQPHVGKARRGVFFEKLIQEIVGPITRFPSHLNLEEQGLFTLGYYHQRQDFFTKKDDAVTAP
jgi:CRISPR-associated protein Csd1